MTLCRRYLLLLFFLALTNIKFAQDEIVLTSIDVISVEEHYKAIHHTGRVYVQPPPPPRYVIDGYRYSLLLELHLKREGFYFGREILVKVEFPNGKIDAEVINKEKNLLEGENYYEFVIDIIIKEAGWYNLSLSEWSSFLDREVESDNIKFIGNSIYLD